MSLRGGAFNNTSTQCRPSCRNHNHPDNHNNNIGVRLVRLWPPHPGPPTAEMAGTTVPRPSPVGRNGAPWVSAWHGCLAAGAAAHLPPGRTLDACIPVRPTSFVRRVSGAATSLKIFGARFARHPRPPPQVRQGQLGGVPRGMGVQGSEWGGHNRTSRTPM